MEKAPNTEKPKMTIEQINAEIARLGRRIMEIEESPMPHDESGSNTPDDQATETVMDDQARALGPEREIADLRHKIAELEELKHKQAA
jgi:hypothetical protein